MKPIGTAGRRTLLALAALALLGAAGCQEPQRRDVGVGSQAHPIAVVNNERITLDEFQDRYQLFLTRWDRYIKNDPAKKQEIKEIILATMIDEKLLDQEARRRGLELDEAEVDAEIRRLTAPWSEDDLVQAAHDVNRPLPEWRALFRRRLTHGRLIEKEVVSKIRVTQRELRAYYERHRKEFIQPEQVKVRHLAVSSRSLYNKVVRRLHRDADFVELVREYSITPDRMDDGDLGYVERGVLPVEFDQAIFNLERVGSFSPTNKPVKTQMGYHIFRLEDRKPEAELSFKQAVPLIRKTLVRQKQPKAFQDWLQGLREKATIRIDKDLLNAALG